MQALMLELRRLPYARLPNERRWSELEAKTARKETKELTTDPFVFNPRRITINKVSQQIEMHSKA